MRAFPDAYRYFKQLDHVHFLGDTTFCELPFLQKIFQELPTELLQRQYNVYILNHHHKLPETGDDVIVIYLSNEDHHVPSFLPDVYRVFTPYPAENSRGTKLCPIPLGYNGDIPHLKEQPFTDRNIDVFFSGRYINTRRPFYQATTTLSDDNFPWSTYFRFTPQFRSGLAPEVYAQYLYDSRIVLAPEGYFHSPVTFRLFEALRAGCIPVSMPLPDTWFFANYPGLQLSEWEHLPDMLRQYLNNPGDLLQLHRQVKNYYYQYCSAGAVAAYIKQEVGI